MMWKIVHIFDGEYGCEERALNVKPEVLVTLENESGRRKYKAVEDEWLRRNGLEEGSEWPEDQEKT